MTDLSPAQHWEQRYAEREQIWSGRPNALLVDLVSSLEPGKVLDLGCGEGGDSVWLATRGWEVTAVDIASTAIARGKALSVERHVPEHQITWLVRDLASWEPTETYGLVSACYFQSFVDLPRIPILQRVASAIAPGGHLLLISHGEAPPWAHGQAHQHHQFFSPAEELVALQLEDSAWRPIVSELRPRETTGPNGETAAVHDSVLLVQKR